MHGGAAAHMLATGSDLPCFLDLQGHPNTSVPAAAAAGGINARPGSPILKHVVCCGAEWPPALRI
jgi:hypothetical protein